jgi:hypothetical protein
VIDANGCIAVKNILFGRETADRRALNKWLLRADCVEKLRLSSAI